MMNFKIRLPKLYTMVISEVKMSEIYLGILNV
jgi:hypothetical protein